MLKTTTRKYLTATSYVPNDPGNAGIPKAKLPITNNKHTSKNFKLILQECMIVKVVPRYIIHKMIL